MMKNRLTLFVFCLTLVCASLPARADKELFQKVKEYQGVVVNHYNWFQNWLSLATETKRSVSEGIGNAQQKINELKNKPLELGEELLDMIPSEIPDINNITKATKQVEKSYNTQMGQGNDIAVHFIQYNKMMDIQRENVANLYAVAFTTRALLAKERQQAEPSNDMRNTREIVKLTNKKAAEMARRLRNIMKLEAAIAEFKFSQEAIAYSVTERQDENIGETK